MERARVLKKRKGKKMKILAPIPIWHNTKAKLGFVEGGN